MTETTSQSVMILAGPQGHTLKVVWPTAFDLDHLATWDFPNKFLSPAGPIFALLGCPLGVACRNELMVNVS